MQLQNTSLVLETPTVEYRDVPGFPGYRVGSDGSVWTCWSRGNIPPFQTPRWHRMKPLASQYGHLRVGLYSDKKKKRILVHHLVLIAFVGPRPSGLICRHFPDRNPANNRVENLQWGTHSENEADAVIHGTRIASETHPRAKMTIAKVIELRKRYANGEGSARKLGKEYGIHDSVVLDIVKRRTWKSVA